MLSFELARAAKRRWTRFSTGLECFTLAESLGGVESLIAHPATMTHAGMDEAARRRAGIGPRTSARVGRHRGSVEDLSADLNAGLARAAAAAAAHLERRPARGLEALDHGRAGARRSAPARRAA